MESATVGRRRALGRAIGMGVATENENAPERVDGWKIRRGIRGVVEGPRGGGEARGEVLGVQGVTASTRTCPSSSTLCLKGSMRNFPRPLIVRVSWSPAPGETRFGHRRIPHHTPEMHPSGYTWEGSRSRPSMTLELPAPVMKGRSRRLRSQDWSSARRPRARGCALVVRARLLFQARDESTARC